MLTELTAISPIDGRYRQKVLELSPYFSETALISYRVFIEIEYFLELCKILPQLKNKLTEEQIYQLQQLWEDEMVARIKEIEKITNHDVKAVEYFLKEQFDRLNFPPNLKEFIHFGLTSQDINQTALPLMVYDGIRDVIIPHLVQLSNQLNKCSSAWKDQSMLARTHGQPASPTTVGKEIYVFRYRLNQELEILSQLKTQAKFGGAVGNFNAHYAAYPEINWHQFADEFVVTLCPNIIRTPYTTQIDSYDWLARFCDSLRRINVILIDCCRDFWTYISMDYFRQEIKAGEVGSSTMPHKVNPIDFENAEGNLGVANALLNHFSEKLPISRLQRDLTDSTVVRNLGVSLGHSLIAYQSLIQGINKISLNSDKINQDLSSHWEVVTEGIQTILRRENYPQPYEVIKALTRTGKSIKQADILTFITELEIDQTIKDEIIKLTPFNYIGKPFPPNQR